jgi:hypothetical protein
MSLDMQDKSADLDESHGNAAGDLQDALSGGDLEFAAPESKPANNRNMLLLGVVLIGAAVVWFMFFKKSPASAEAAPADEEKQVARQAISDFLGGGSENIAQMEQLLKNTEQVVGKFTAYPSTTQVPLEDLKTNPFRQFIASIDTTATQSKLATQKRHEEERQAAIKRASELQLQSLISGKTKACMINNTMYREGQQISDDCVVERITSDAVVVRVGTFRFALKMQQ